MSGATVSGGRSLTCCRRRYLIEEQANVNAVDSNGDTACHDAARFGHGTVVGCDARLSSVPWMLVDDD